FQAEDGIRDFHVTGVQTCALPIFSQPPHVWLYGQLTTDAGTQANADLATLQTLIEQSLAAAAERAAKVTVDDLRSQTIKLSYVRSEERRVGKECRATRAQGHAKEE